VLFIFGVLLETAKCSVPNQIWGKRLSHRGQPKPLRNLSSPNIPSQQSRFIWLFRHQQEPTRFPIQSFLAIYHFHRNGFKGWTHSLFSAINEYEGN
jgi:hypothetical protein